ncbi:hypothetical protein NS115_03875 [Paenibacillus jamilae]|uniref:Uncharacterized protein n=2 Tax=Bacteria TaxID=2 RepID=A0ACC4ZZM6_9BACL|nr:hypothetical protein [Paenibacillus jamilae]KTS84474.1 hypothetical protein NS115_03875 [Paenibacillus jamilae]
MQKRFSLPLNLQLFGDEGGAEGGNPTGGTDPTPGGEPTPPNPEAPKDIMIPKTRFDEVNANYKSVKEQLDQFLAAQKQAEDDAAKQRGEYEQLYNTAQQEVGTYKEQAEKTSARVQELEGLLGTMLDTKLADIPEAMRDLIPENLSPEQKLAWIDKAAARGVFGSPKQPEVPVGGSTNPGNTTPPDISGLDPFSLLKAGYGSK